MQNVHFQTWVTVLERICRIIYFRFADRSSFTVFECVYQTLSRVHTTPTFCREAFPTHQIMGLIRIVELSNKDELITSVSFFPKQLCIFTCIIFIVQFVQSQIHYIFSFCGRSVPVPIIKSCSCLHSHSCTFSDASVIRSSPFCWQSSDSFVKISHYFFIDFCSRHACYTFHIFQI